MAKKQVSPGVLALRKVVDDVHKDAREAKKRGELVGWSSSKFPCELAAAFDLNVMYPENQAAGIAANRYGEMMCQAAEDLGYDNDICGYARISLAYAAGVRVARKFDPETGEYIIDPSTGKPLKDENGNVVLGDEMLTPDSSRFWPLEGYEPGHSQPSFDKQFVRDWLKANPDSNYDLPQDVIDKTIAKYLEAYELLTGKKL